MACGGFRAVVGSKLRVMTRLQLNLLRVQAWPLIRSVFLQFLASVARSHEMSAAAPLSRESVAKLFCWERVNFLTAAEAFDVSGLGGPRQLRPVRSAILLFVFRRCL